MKKVVSILTIIMLVACSMLGVVSAKSIDGSIGYGEDVIVTKNETTGDLHTAIVASNVVNGPIKVENTIQRKNSSGNLVNRGRGYFYMATIGQDSHINYSIGSTAQTRSVWFNMTNNSFLQGRFYINNGLLP